MHPNSLTTRRVVNRRSHGGIACSALAWPPEQRDQIFRRRPAAPARPAGASPASRRNGAPATHIPLVGSGETTSAARRSGPLSRREQHDGHRNTAGRLLLETRTRSRSRPWGEKPSLREAKAVVTITLVGNTMLTTSSSTGDTVVRRPQMPVDDALAEGRVDHWQDRAPVDVAEHPFVFVTEPHRHAADLSCLNFIARENHDVRHGPRRTARITT
jgi:hypothetical protein